MMVAAVFAVLTSISLPAQDADATAPASDSGKVTYAATAGGYGDLAASHAYEMSSVLCELDGKLDSRTAKVGDRVVLRTRDKVVTTDGTQVPGGTRLVGHVTEVQTYDPDRGPARIAIALDHAELKKGQTLAIYALIRGMSPARAMTANQPSDNSMIGMPVSIDAQVNGGRMSPDYGTIAATDGTGAGAGRTGRSDDANAREPNKADGSSSSTVPIEQASGDMDGHTGAHELAAARAVPHPTNVPGVMLAGNSSSSGVLVAPIDDIQLVSGTQFQVGVTANR
jgi:hypothetical protein